MDDGLAQQQPHVLSFSTHNPPQAECVAADTPLKPGRIIFDSRLTWRLHEMNGDYAICMYRGAADNVYQTLGLSRDFSSAQLNPTTGGDASIDVGFSLDGPLFQLWANFLLLQSRGVVLHALGVMVDGEAHLFCGPSGVGKTTLGRLIKNAGIGTILSDDRIIVRQKGATFYAYGTPWNGETAFHSAENAPVRKIHFLRHFSSCDIRRISRPDAATRLFALSSVAGWPVDGAINSVLDFTAHLSSAATCDLFGFTPDYRSIEALGWT